MSEIEAATELLRYFRDLALFLPFDLDAVTQEYSSILKLTELGNHVLPWLDPDSVINH